MKDKEMIEEMAKDLGIAFQLAGTTSFVKVAEILVEKYQSKLPENSVVLSADEFANLKKYAYKKGSKETAEKCRNFIKKWVGNDEEGLGFLFDFENFITKQFGVEVK